MTTPIDFFEAHLGAEDKRPATVRQYGDLLHRFELYLQENYRLSLTSDDLPHITGMHLSAYLQHLAHDREISTRNNYIVILKRFFGYMLSIGCDPSGSLSCAALHQGEDDAARRSSAAQGSDIPQRMSNCCSRRFSAPGRDGRICATPQSSP